MSEITTWITQHGVTEQMLILLLFIPIIATIVNLSRYLIGFKTLGIYAPMTLSFAYIFTGIRFGLLVTLAVILSTLLTYSLLKKIRMHYLSRITINYILISVLVVGVIVLNDVSPISLTTEHHDATTIPPLGVILIATLSDFFIKQYVKKDFLNSARSLGETVLVGIAGWLALRSPQLQQFVLNNVWIFLILLLVNLGLGKYTGMRFKDLLRFEQILKNDKSSS
ncbi:hypothetical protein H6763_03305 [Candidatus Nomurabacteria bacterium]|uniref:7 transmembrane helices usually fused to an inactive transglutaminase domain-containing protein n=1 Tax=Candidatus Dojkabacteria bacterium TaxID=2099670 RepID=A0A955KXP8_9BACT|nr:hypothetical protein [Candidatus Dojkabacteria bacterium]MCB9789737.1 hypothetical protein [Candidatus Nomurabacteria bacterium]MCB9803834.1 hypothetical protein [Candidatus Nomurabacteria bacterium]